MKVAFLMAACLLSCVFCSPLGKKSEHVLRSESDVFGRADINGDGSLDVETELSEYLTLRAKSSPADIVPKEAHQALNENIVHQLKESGVRRISRAEAESGKISEALQSSQAAGDKWLWSTPAPTYSMQQGCDRVLSLANLACTEFNSLDATLPCAGTLKTDNKLIRGTIVINKPIDTVMAALQNRQAWLKYDSKMTLISEDAASSNANIGTVVDITYSDGSYTAAVKLHESWCSTTGATRVAYATRYASTSYLIDINVDVAGIVLKDLSGKTEVTYVTKATIGGLASLVTSDTGPARHSAVEIPTAMKTAIEAAL